MYNVKETAQNSNTKSWARITNGNKGLSAN